MSGPTTRPSAGRAARQSALRLVLLAAIVLGAAGAPAAPPPAAPAAGGTPAALATAAPSAPARTLVAIARAQPEGVAARGLRAVAGRTIDTTLRFWNAGLALANEREVPSPYLAEALPQLDTDSWRVFPDGRMETTYRLKPNLTWHDGTPLSAEDFAFAYRVYNTPELGEAGLPPMRQLDDVVAVDARTVRFVWKELYADAGSLQANQQTGFQALPRHVLERAFQTAAASPDAFVAHPFWGGEYVGLGPFRVTRFEHGSAIEGAAFDKAALGRPKIDRIRLRFMSDANTVLANLLAGEAHIAIDDSIRFQQASVLLRDWAPRNLGTVILSPAQVRYTAVQLRPDIATPRTLLDVRVRRALAHAIDRPGLADAMLEGRGLPADTMIVPQVDYAAAESALTRYPYDPRRAEQLLAEVGYSRGADGILTHPAEGRLAPEVRVLASPANETEAAVVADSLRRLGTESSIYVVSQAEAQDGRLRASFPTLSASSVINGSEVPIDRLRASEIATADNRWRGSNFGGWANADFERLVVAYESSLERTDRSRYAVQLLKLVSDEVPAIPLFYNFMVAPHVAALQGPTQAVSARTAGWNVHEWQWR